MRERKTVSERRRRRLDEEKPSCVEEQVACERNRGQGEAGGEETAGGVDTRESHSTYQLEKPLLISER